MSAALYEYCGKQVRVWMPVLPWFVTLSLFVLSINADHRGYWKKNIFLVAFGLYLHFWQWALYVFQVAFASVREDAFISNSSPYVHPLFSQEGFYLTALVSVFVLYSFAWRQDISMTWWFFIWIFLTGPPAVFIWFGYSLWWEVLFGMGLGFLATAAYVIVFRIYLLDHVPYLLCQTR